MNREQRIKERVQKVFHPVYLEVINESSDHNVPLGSESHFKLLVVSSAFGSLSRVERQKQVYDSLRSEFESGLHALALRALTPEEWETQGGKPFQSPPCQGKK